MAAPLSDASSSSSSKTVSAAESAIQHSTESIAEKSTTVQSDERTENGSDSSNVSPHTSGSAASTVQTGSTGQKAPALSPPNASSSLEPANKAAPAHSASSSSNNAKILKGAVSHTVSPFKEDGSVETVKEGTPIKLVFSANLNSEVSQVGDKVIARVSMDLKDGNKVILPGQWYVVGKIARIEGRKRMGRDGYCEIKFEKLVSPDCKFEAAIDATISTKDSAVKTVATQAAKSTAMMSVGAFAGSLLSVQVTGLPVAISTYGLSVAVGAAAGATIGAFAFLRKKGDILCTVPGDELTVKLPFPINLPAFNQEAIQQISHKIPKLDKVNIIVDEKQFRADPSGDKQSRLLYVKIRIENQSNKTYSFENIAVISDRGEQYCPYVTSMVDKQRFQKVAPQATKEAAITFGVASPKFKYWLVLWDQARSNILSQVPIN